MSDLLTSSDHLRRLANEAWRLTHQRGRAAGLFETVSLRNMPWLSAASVFPLASEAHPSIGIDGERLAQAVERDVAIELRIARAIISAPMRATALLPAASS